MRTGPRTVTARCPRTPTSPGARLELVDPRTRTARRGSRSRLGLVSGGPQGRIVIRAELEIRSFDEVLLGRWRSRAPLEAARTPWIGGRSLTEQQRMNQVSEREQHAQSQQPRPQCRHHVERLKASRIVVVAPWHAGIAEQELRHERAQETAEYQGKAERPEPFGIHAPR